MSDTKDKLESKLSAEVQKRQEARAAELKNLREQLSKVLNVEANTYGLKDEDISPEHVQAQLKALNGMISSLITFRNNFQFHWTSQLSSAQRMEACTNQFREVNQAMGGLETSLTFLKGAAPGSYKQGALDTLSRYCDGFAGTAQHLKDHFLPDLRWGTENPPAPPVLFGGPGAPGGIMAPCMDADPAPKEQPKSSNPGSK